MAGQYGHVYCKMNGQYTAVRFLRGWLREHRQRLSCSPALRRCCGDCAVLIICATCLSALCPPVGVLFAHRRSICLSALCSRRCAIRLSACYPLVSALPVGVLFARRCSVCVGARSAHQRFCPPGGRRRQKNSPENALRGVVCVVLTGAVCAERALTWRSPRCGSRG